MTDALAWSKAARGIVDLDSLSKQASHVKDPFPHQLDHIILKGFHAKLAKVRLERDACPVISGLASCDLWLSLAAHVCTEHLHTDS